MLNRAVAAVLTAAFLSFSTGSWAASDVPKVVVSIKPIHSLMAGLMQGFGEPVLIVDGESTPYDEQMTSAEQRALEQADLVVWIGPELEGFLVDHVSKLSSDTRVVALLDSGELKVLPSRQAEDRRDPFLWLDSRNALILIDELAAILTEVDPDRAAQYEENRVKILREVAGIDRQLEYQYRDVSAVPVGLYHDTQQYFEQAYATSVVARVTARPDEEVSTADLLEARTRLAQMNVHCFFTEAGLPSPNLGILTGGLDMRVAELDSLGTGLAAGPGLYVELMRRNFNTIRECVKPTAEAIGAERPAHVDLDSYTRDTAAPLTGRFLLMNHHGQAVSNLDFLGKFQLVYFGYTFCPDICPTSLSVTAAALNQLGEKAERIQPIFITVDPARDTVEVMSKYVAFFHPSLIGLTGRQEMVDRVAADFGVLYEKVPSEDGDPDKYSVDHSASLYLLDPNGQFLTKFAHGITPEALAGRLNDYLQAD